MRFWIKDKEMSYEKLSKKPEPPSRSKKYYKAKGGCSPEIASKNSRKNRHLTPWSRFNPNWLNKKKISTPANDLKVSKEVLSKG